MCTCIECTITNLTHWKNVKKHWYIVKSHRSLRCFICCKLINEVDSPAIFVQEVEQYHSAIQQSSGKKTTDKTSNRPRNQLHL